jgi:hypothetical protein
VLSQAERRSLEQIEHRLQASDPAFAARMCRLRTDVDT